MVFGGRDSKQRNRIMTKLLNKGFAITDGRRAPSKAMAKAAPMKAAPKTSTTRKTPRSKGTWGVQVGAYAKYGQAYKSANDAQDMAKRYLAAGTVKVVPLRTRRGKTLYRARIHGLGKRTAYAACKALEKQSRDCMELRVGSVQLASNMR